MYMDVHAIPRIRADFTVTMSIVASYLFNGVGVGSNSSSLI